MAQQPRKRYPCRRNRPQLESMEEKVLLSTLHAGAATAAKSAALVQTLDTSGGLVSSPSNRFPRARYVTQLYHTILGREPEPAGLTFWVHELQRGMSRTAVRRQFLLAA